MVRPREAKPFTRRHKDLARIDQMLEQAKIDTLLDDILR